MPAALAAIPSPLNGVDPFPTRVRILPVPWRRSGGQSEAPLRRTRIGRSSAIPRRLAPHRFASTEVAHRESHPSHNEEDDCGHNERYSENNAGTCELGPPCPVLGRSSHTSRGPVLGVHLMATRPHRSYEIASHCPASSSTRRSLVAPYVSRWTLPFRSSCVASRPSASNVSVYPASFSTSHLRPSALPKRTHSPVTPRLRPSLPSHLSCMTIRPRRSELPLGLPASLPTKDRPAGRSAQPPSG